MKKIILNMALLIILAMPCLLALNDENPITGKSNIVVNILGIIYTIWFAKCIVKKVFKNLPEPE